MATMTARQQQFFAAIPDSWKTPLRKVCERPEIDALVQYLQEREADGAILYPAKQNIFAALRATPFEQVKVIIVGQDPYHGPGQAHGLCFSVQPGIPVPPSLRNIFQELHNSMGMPIPQNGTLTKWATQGVLLLNAILTVEQGKPASHAGRGWELFTDAIIDQLLKRNQPLVLMLWGAYAQKKVHNLQASIDPALHLILKAAHPSPFSASGFFGCDHFSKANAFLQNHAVPEINWALL
jgi:uracil-DNA glycosylase